MSDVLVLDLPDYAVRIPDGENGESFNLPYKTYKSFACAALGIIEGRSNSIMSIFKIGSVAAGLDIFIESAPVLTIIVQPKEKKVSLLSAALDSTAAAVLCNTTDSKVGWHRILTLARNEIDHASF